MGRLHELLDAQAYRLAHWRVAADEINYRRLDINDLAGVRSELPEVFEDVHRELFRLIHRGCVHGLRIDHPDGCAIRACISKLQARAALRTPAPGRSSSWSRRYWRRMSTCPTSGQSMARPATSLPMSSTDCSSIRGSRTLQPDLFGVHWRACKLRQHAVQCQEARAVGDAVVRACAACRAIAVGRAELARDARFHAEHPAFRAGFGDRRISPSIAPTSSPAMSDQDRRHVKQAVKCKREASRQIDPSVFEFIHDVLLHDDSPHAAAFVHASSR